MYHLSINRQNKKCVKLFENLGVHGCFLSHWLLWKKCVELNENIGIFEDDVLFFKSFSDKKFIDVLKLEKLKQGKKYAGGDWWEGAHAYIISPTGAKKILAWIDKNGALPADWMLGTDIVDIKFDDHQSVAINLDSQVDLNTQSLTRNLK
jgi:GR25 family glycosyltransferase involved in LPS biosynthesis